MKVFVFGGDGFVGKYLCLDLVKQGYEVVICDINHTSKHEVYDRCSYVNIDIRNSNEFSKLGMTSNDIAINLAANQYHNKIPKNAKDYFFLTNVEGTRNIINYLKSVGCTKYIMYSTDMTYGLPKYVPVDVKHPQEPFGFYGQSKYEAEKICREFRVSGGNCTIFRPRIIVGPGRLGILKKLFKLIKNNLPVPMIGTGRNHYQMISVYDCVSATIAAINKGIPNSEYNLGSLNPPPIKILLSGFIKDVNSHSLLIPTWGWGVKTTLSFLNLIGFHLMYKEQYKIADAEYLVDISNTMKELDWSPKYSDDQMISQAYDFYIKSLDKQE